MTTENNKTKDILEGMQNKYYDLEVFANKYQLGFDPHNIKDAKIEKYNHVLLVNVNGLGIGQAHFITDNGSYLLLPWAYILTMKESVFSDEEK